MGTQLPSPKGALQPPSFQLMSTVAKLSPISASAEHSFNWTIYYCHHRSRCICQAASNRHVLYRCHQQLIHLTGCGNVLPNSGNSWHSQAVSVHSYGARYGRVFPYCILSYRYILLHIILYPPLLYPIITRRCQPA